ncbi:MAG: diacylglycerol/polyprenol kinase family protein [Elusimicrobiota bacterium]
MWPEIKRKLFHFTSFIYVLGLVYCPRHIFIIIILLVLLSEIMIEYLRLKNTFFRTLFLKYFGSLIREHEREHFTGVFWMLLGVLLVSVILPPPSLAVCALLYLILGDAIASLVGKRLQGPAWPRSPKKIVGSAACFLLCFFIGYILLRPEYGWSGVIWGAIIATWVEKGIIKLDDNFTIPFFGALTLALCYHIKPFFL